MLFLCWCGCSFWPPFPPKIPAPGSLCHIRIDFRLRFRPFLEIWLCIGSSPSPLNPPITLSSQKQSRSRLRPAQTFPTRFVARLLLSIAATRFRRSVLQSHLIIRIFQAYLLFLSASVYRFLWLWRWLLSSARSQRSTRGNNGCIWRSPAEA